MTTSLKYLVLLNNQTKLAIYVYDKYIYRNSKEYMLVENLCFVVQGDSSN